MASELLDRIGKINVWKKHGVRAPHKPLLLLFALAEFKRGFREVRFAEAEPKLKRLLEEFGPTRRLYQAELPFWWLQGDGLWKLSAKQAMRPRQSSACPPRTEFIRADAVGTLPPPIQEALERDSTLLPSAARRILDAHFPESLHDEILAEVGLSLDAVTTERPARDPRFRERILEAYEHRCAVCGFDLRLGNVLIALEAAHIMWHQAGGPDTDDNGVALCALHHKIFDHGAFTIDGQYRILVSEKVHGVVALEDALLRHHGRGLRLPPRAERAPAAAHLKWHHREVFKREARPVA